MARETYNGVVYDCSDRYSYKDMTGWDLSDRPDMNGLVICGTCLSNETPDARVLPRGLLGCTFIFCNLCNVYVPDGNRIIECQTTRFKVQNDGGDWSIDDRGSPISPIDPGLYQEIGLSIDPADLPAKDLHVNLIVQKIEENLR